MTEYGQNVIITINYTKETGEDMLSIRNIVKTYKPKKGVPVKALDDVSLDFKETGLVFILGKSGSGKSTLLNAIGGLDKVDSGEFVIKGKSSKEFTAGDFDAYRNTFIGFIFQEYNILGEFTVGQNIALAMELQGKKATSEALNNILTEVDLNGYANRKPNELSGGQKQRVAIARALIKEPEIIMADEPTGALDSNTGKQVFDTLKKLSKTKLVIVVSHDREFAEYYGDRVIELADGKIISDISKYEAEPEAKSEGINIIDNSILQIKEGYTLTENDLTIINEYLKKQSCGTIISSDKRTNDNLKQIAMISEDGGKASFKDTSEEDTRTDPYDKSKTKFIKSRLPYKNALKIGASSLKVKPLRLFFTILLSFISFAMFGITDTLAAYNEQETTTQSIINSGVSYVAYSVANKVEGTNYYEQISTNDSTLAALESETGMDFYPVTRGESIYSGISLPISMYDNSQYYSNSTAGLTEMGEEPLLQMGATITGRMPKGYDEIAITKYHFEVLNKLGMMCYNADGTPSSINAGKLTLDDDPSTGVLNKVIELYISKNIKFTIVGVVDTKLDEKYDALKSNEENNIMDYAKYREFESSVRNGIHGMLFGKTGLIQRIYSGNEDSTIRYDIQICNKDSYPLLYWGKINKLSNIDEQAIYWINEKKQSLNNDEILITSATLLDALNNASITISEFEDWYFDGSKFVSISRSIMLSDLRNINNKFICEYIMEKGVPQWYIDKYNLSNFNQNEQINSYYEYLVNNIDYIENEDTIEINKRKVQYAVNVITEEDLIDFNDLYLAKQGFYHNQTVVKVVGVVIDRNYDLGFVSDAYYDDFAPKGYYSMFVGVMPKDAGSVKKLVNLTYNYELQSGMKLTMHNAVTTTMDSINSMIYMFAQIFLYVGIAMAAFSAMLLSNFIAVSIANKKREIGILRAVGAKSSDVFTIFFNESLIIALINFVLALIGAIVAVIALNNTFTAQLGLSITLLSFGIRQIALMLALSIGVALIASFLPVYSIAKKQPIDSIQGR